MSNKAVWAFLFITAALLASTSFALGYIFGTQEKAPIVVEKCSE